MKSCGSEPCNISALLIRNLQPLANRFIRYHRRPDRTKTNLPILRHLQSALCSLHRHLPRQSICEKRLKRTNRDMDVWLLAYLTFWQIMMRIWSCSLFHEGKSDSVRHISNSVSTLSCQNLGSCCAHGQSKCRKCGCERGLYIGFKLSASINLQLEPTCDQPRCHPRIWIPVASKFKSQSLQESDAHNRIESQKYTMRFHQNHNACWFTNTSCLC